MRVDGKAAILSRRGRANQRMRPTYEKLTGYRGEPGRPCGERLRGADSLPFCAVRAESPLKSATCAAKAEGRRPCVPAVCTKVGAWFLQSVAMAACRLPISDTQATPKRVESVYKACTKRVQSHPKASIKRLQSAYKAPQEGESWGAAAVLAGIGPKSRGRVCCSLARLY